MFWLRIRDNLLTIKEVQQRNQLPQKMLTAPKLAAFILSVRYVLIWIHALTWWVDLIPLQAPSNSGQLMIPKWAPQFKGIDKLQHIQRGMPDGEGCKNWDVIWYLSSNNQRGKTQDMKQYKRVKHRIWNNTGFCVFRGAQRVQLESASHSFLLDSDVLWVEIQCYILSLAKIFNPALHK